MPAFVTFGRILFCVIFIVSGAFKLLDIDKTAGMIEAKVAIPAMIATYTDQIVSAAGKPMPQLLAIAAGALELVCGLMIALNFGARFFAIVLAIFVVVATLYFHDFWNQSGAEAQANMISAMKNLSLLGALFIIAGIGGRSRAQTAYNDV